MPDMQFSRRSPVHCSKEASEGAANLNALDEYGDLRFTIRDKWKKAIDGNCGSVPTVKQIFNIFHVHENCHWSTAKNYNIKKSLQNITHERKKKETKNPLFQFRFRILPPSQKLRRRFQIAVGHQQYCTLSSLALHICAITARHARWCEWRLTGIQHSSRSCEIHSPHWPK